MTHPKSLLYIFFDFLALNYALFITYYWFFNGSSFFLNPEFKLITILVNTLWFATLLYSNSIYKKFEYSSFLDEIKNLLPNYLIFISAFYVLSMAFFKTVGFSFTLYYGLLFVFLLSSRLLIKFSVSFKRLNYVTIGYCDALAMIEKSLRDAHRGQTNFLGTFSDSAEHHEKHLGSVEEIGAFLRQNKVNLILYVSNTMTPAMLRDLMHYAKLNFIEFKIIPLELDYLTEGAKVELHHGVFLSAKDQYFTQLSYRFFKRLFDIVFSLIVVVFILSWLFPLICLLIVLETRGAPLFLQNRVGFRGKVFHCFKFRSMRVRENGHEIVQARINDTRVTKVGAFLRKSNLDEMPQFINVLLGDMSVVGPRPHAVSHDIQFKNAKEDYTLRHYLKPGITGWAQVNGWRGPTDTQNKIFGRTECDLWYVQNRSLLLDIKIIFLTLLGSKAWQNVF